MKNLWVVEPIFNIEIQTTRPLPSDYPKTLETFADHIQAKRIQEKLSKRELSKKLGITTSTLWTWNKRGTIPVPEVMKRVIDWLDYVPPLGIDENSLGGKIFIYRMKYGLNQSDLARMLKIGRYSISQIENQKPISENNLKKISRFLKKEELTSSSSEN